MVSYALLPWFLTIFFFLVIVTVLWHLCSVSAFVFVDGLPSDVTFACLSLTQFCFFLDILSVVAFLTT